MPIVRFVNVGLEVDVPEGTSVLEAAREIGAPEGSHCGGVCACSTCHVYVLRGDDALSPQLEDEREMLELAAKDLRSESRLGCQTKVMGDCSLSISEESFQTYLDDNPSERDQALQLWLTGQS